MCSISTCTIYSDQRRLVEVSALSLFTFFIRVALSMQDQLKLFSALMHFTRCLCCASMNQDGAGMSIT